MGKRFGSFASISIVALLLFSSVFSLIGTIQATAAQDGDYTYTVSGGVATITGYTGTGGAVAIPSTLGGYPTVAIGDYAFAALATLKSVTIPNSVTSIDYAAFLRCTSLTSVTIGNSVAYIADAAFEDCSSLASINIPNSVTSIGNRSFSTCGSMTGVTIGSGVTSIGGGAFSSCGSLSSLIVPNGVTSIGPLAFAYTSMTDVTIGSGVTSIGERAFDCISLTSIGVNSNNPSFASVQGVLYNKATTELIQFPSGKTGTVTIPDGVISIDSHAFDACNLTSVIIPSSISIIGGDAFSYSNALVSIVFKGNAPPIDSTSVERIGSSVAIYYYEGATGFSTPLWNGVPTYPITSTPTIPTIPQDLSAEPGSNQVQLFWTAPSNNGGSIIDYYVVYQDGVDVMHVTHRWAVIEGLKEQSYIFAIATHTSAGIGPKTSPLTVTLAASYDILSILIIMSVLVLALLASLFLIKRRGKNISIQTKIQNKTEIQEELSKTLPAPTDMSDQSAALNRSLVYTNQSQLTLPQPTHPTQQNNVQTSQATKDKVEGYRNMINGGTFFTIFGIFCFFLFTPDSAGYIVFPTLITLMGLAMLTGGVVKLGRKASSKNILSDTLGMAMGNAIKIAGAFLLLFGIIGLGIRRAGSDPYFMLLGLLMVIIGIIMLVFGQIKVNKTVEKNKSQQENLEQSEFLGKVYHGGGRNGPR